jgi:hypothetical protein
MKLISMTDFVLHQHAESSNQNEFEDNCFNYANFLKQEIKLEMFVPCIDNIPFSELQLEILNSDDAVPELRKVHKQAKEKVLFEGFEIATNKEGEKFILGDYTCLKISDLENGDVEDLVKYVHIKLTPNAIKRIFG